MSLAERRAQLLDAATAVISRRGLAAASTRAITETAGVPQSVFHYCFDSKAALFRALLERENERIQAIVEASSPNSVPLSAALEAAFVAHLRRVQADPSHFLALSELGVHARTDEELLALTQRARRRDLDAIQSLLQEWRTDLDPHAVDAWASVILAGVDGITEAWLTDRDDESALRSTRLLARAMETLAGDHAVPHTNG